MTVASPASNEPLRGAVARLADALEPGQVYRREELARLSNAVDRHLRELVATGTLRKLAQGLYHMPRQSPFGTVPASDDQLVKGFLRDKEFLVFSPSLYNGLGIGTTQLYNKTLVYNHKRHGQFRLGSRLFDFRVKHRFPKTPSQEFLYVDLLNNLEELAEDRDAVLLRAKEKVSAFEFVALQEAVETYGNMATRKRFRQWVGG